MAKTVKVTIIEICYHDVRIPLSDLDKETQALMENGPVDTWFDIPKNIHDWLHRQEYWAGDPYDPETHVLKIREVTK